MYKFQKEKDGYIFKAPSKYKHKKYDVFDKSGKYIVSFGDNRYQHFHDKLNYYKSLNHGNQKRRDLYYARHGDDGKATPNSAKYFSHNYLW